ncbi:MAG: glycerol-3-phosphate 1-O-acyltransferase PlsY [Rhodobacteraceae bacterium]|nr:glycerol-3-phosphate 1-O-acyltransferase PlsY [Paracoccaceae bacterium]
MPEFDITAPAAVLVLLAGYALGSISFGVVVARIMGLGNLRGIGSGNIGATNVLRTGNRCAAFLTLVLDAGKGAAALLIARALCGEIAGQIAGAGAFLGHLFPVWLGFKGGKGVATFLGIFVAAGFRAGCATCMTWLAVAIVWRISSASGLAAAALAPLWAGLLGYPQGVGLAVFLGGLIWWSHRANILRLINGTEPKIGSNR